MRWAACLLVALFSFVDPTVSSSMATGIGRSTNSRDADLIDALIVGGRFDDALKICESRLRGTSPDSDRIAKWTIRKSQILTADQMGRDAFEEDDVQRVQQPTTRLLEAYPNHRRRLFLEAQNVEVTRDAALHSVLRAAVAPTNDQMREVALKRLSRATTELLSFSDRVGDARSILDSQPGSKEAALVADLVRLKQELYVDAVSLALMQTELFPEGSTDRIAAASRAEQAADEAIAQLPADSPARLEVQRLRAEAIFRTEQIGRAESELKELVRRVGQPTPPMILALQVRLDLAKQQLQPAGALLQAYYGQSPQNAPKSIDMDLARLEFLLQSNDRNVGAWFDAIGRRGGAYARRRAEAISLARLGRTNAGSRSPSVDPALIAAQGQDWLRRGEPGRAGELLAAAAAADPDSDRAIQRAGEAAAALVAANREPEAVKVLVDISKAKPDGAKAAATHLQAAVMLSTSDNLDASKLESLLRENLAQWPSGEVAAVGRKWLDKLLSGQRRYTEAAEVLTRLPISDVTSDNVQLVFDRWRQAFRSADDDSNADTAQRFQTSIKPIIGNDLVRAQYPLAAALLLDRDAISNLPAANNLDPFAEALLKFRKDKTVTDPLRNPPPNLVSDVTWRLMRDGRKYPQLRKAISELLTSWDGDSEPSLEQAERTLWSGSTNRAVSMLRELIKQNSASAELAQEAARLLGSVDDRAAREEAIKLWDEIAAGAEQRSGLWHDAKLNAIRQLEKSGRRAEAQKRAKYILLTSPGLDSGLKDQYRAAAGIP